MCGQNGRKYVELGDNKKLVKGLNKNRGSNGKVNHDGILKGIMRGMP